MIIYQKSKYFSAEQAQDNLTGLSPLLVRALRARGAVTPEQIERFLHPSAEDFHDPFLLPDMDKAVQRIHAALENGERICISEITMLTVFVQPPCSLIIFIQSVQM